jgi:hypothetical protein
MKKSITEIPLVQEDQLINVIDLLKGSLTDQQIAFIKNRWLHQVIYWDQRSRKSRQRYFTLRSLTVLGSVAIPVFTSLALTYSSHKEFSVIAIILGALVAASTAWEGIANYGQIWIEKRRAAELLKVEGWLFFELADHYSVGSYADNFKSFAASVENLIAKEIGEYVAVFDASKAKERLEDFEKLIKTAIEQNLSKK